MAKIKLDVPLLAQEKSMCCWHTSANMIWLYWQRQSGRHGPMYTVAPTYESNTGIGPGAFIVLARAVGLSELPTQNTFASDDLFRYLRDKGPLWCAGFWYGLGHIVVLTGVDGGMVYINDPDGGVKKSGTLAWFNAKLSNEVPGCLMYKDPNRY